MLDSLHCFFLLSNPFFYFSLSLSPNSLSPTCLFYLQFSILPIISPFSSFYLLFFRFVFTSTLSSSTHHIFFLCFSSHFFYNRIFNTFVFFLALISLFTVCIAISLFSLFFLFPLSSYYLCQRFRFVQTFSFFYLYHPFYFFPSLSISSHSPLLSNSHVSFLYL